MITGDGLPNPNPVRMGSWVTLPEGREWGSTAGIDIDAVRSTPRVISLITETSGQPDAWRSGLPRETMLIGLHVARGAIVEVSPGGEVSVSR